MIQKRSQSFAVKFGIITVLVLSALGLVFRFLKPNSTPHSTNEVESSQLIADFGTFTDKLLVPVIELDVPDRTLEKHWISALATKLNGEAEVVVPYGRVDVVTDSYAIEVDFMHKFKEGIGQALHYGEVKGIIPGLALIYERSESETDQDIVDKLGHIESLCTAKGIRLFLLKQK